MNEAHITDIWDHLMDKYGKHITKLFKNNEWQTALPYVYSDGEWKPIGTTAPEEPEVEETDEYITFSSPNSFTLQTRTPGIYWDGILEYSTNGETWTEWDGSNITAGSITRSEYIILMRGTGNTYISPRDITQTSFNSWSIGYQPKSWWLQGTAGSINISGNIANLLDYTVVAAGNIPTLAQQAFYALFTSNGTLGNIENLILPFTQLTYCCYWAMFAYCNNLTTTIMELPAITLATKCYIYMFMSCSHLTKTMPILPATTLAEECYKNMFDGCTRLTTAPILPAITLASYCYQSMFNNCTGLVTAPELPALTLAYACYKYMFENCTSLIIAPKLPATNISSASLYECYEGMFQNCTSLIAAPELPATSVTRFGYYSMFENCTSLTTAPELPATSVWPETYRNMFKGCTSLINAPVLPATSVGYNAYRNMFENCTSLITPPDLPATTIDSDCYREMFKGCTSLKTLPNLPAIVLKDRCYQDMFRGCTSIKISETQTGIYQKAYRIPTEETGTTATNALTDMFTGTGGTFTSTPTINTTYYTPDTSFVTLSSPNSFTLATQGGSKYWNGTIEYSTDSINWSTWDGTSISSGSNNSRQELLLRGTGNTTLTGVTNGTTYASNTAPNFQWNITGSNVTLSGDIAYLIDYSNIATTVPTNTCFAWLFRNNTALIDATNFILSYLTTSQYCYHGMFYGCSNLINPPQLLATIIDGYSCQYMFAKCSSLVKTPNIAINDVKANGFARMFQGCSSLVTTVQELPAQVLHSQVYYYMFEGCSSLVKAPEIKGTSFYNPSSCAHMFKNCTSLTQIQSILPITQLSGSCYYCMFQGCTSLVTAPQLPAKVLAQDCYYYMFYGCTSLTTAPELPATTLAQSCYQGMFNGCTSLMIAPKLPAKNAPDSCYREMFKNCTSLILPPELPATTINTNSYTQMFAGCTSLIRPTELPALILANHCYNSMFKDCIKIKLSATQINEYTIPYRIPTVGEGTDATSSTVTMISGTGGTFTSTPSINFTYYLYNDSNNNYITINSASNFSLSTNNLTKNWNGTIEYSNNGTTWTVWDGTNINSGNINNQPAILLRGINNTTLTNLTASVNSSNIITNWTLTGSNISISGNIGYLLNYQTATPETLILDPYCFYGLFKNNTSIINIKKLQFPFTTLSSYCFSNMFEGCSSIADMPNLPAMTLGNYCYNEMFRNCNSLENLTSLPATTMAEGCYQLMFCGCSSLYQPMELNSMNLAINCYAGMFRDCISITTPLNLPATTLPDNCYKGMFYGCTSIKLSDTNTNGYTKIYTIPYYEDLSQLQITEVVSALSTMFGNTGGTFTGTPAINTPYYLYEEELFNITSPYEFTLCTNNNTKNWDGILEYSTDKEHWNTWVGTTIYANKYRGQYTIFLRGTNNTKLQTITSDNSGTVSAQNQYWVLKGNNINLNGDIGTLLNYNNISTILSSSYNFTALFKNNHSIIHAKNLRLSFTNLKQHCYSHLFENCSNLLTPPIISATTLDTYCYHYMFYNCTSLITAPTLIATTLKDSCYYGMFSGCTALTIAPELSATTLANSCYSYMFYNCYKLITPPELSVTTLTISCYSSMFYNCTSLTIAPELPATTLANNCYTNMFYGCSSLITVPELPATTLTNNCYQSMFYGCTSLISAPELSATILTEYCYYQMFYGCDSLITPPILPATTLAHSCYRSMFQNCNKLTTVPKLPATTLQADCYYQMFRGCSSLINISELPVLTLTSRCYYQMFYGCSKIKLSETQVDEYTIPYCIPSSGTGITATNALYQMFNSTGGTFKAAPSINTTYYLSNTNSIVSAT